MEKKKKGNDAMKNFTCRISDYEREVLEEKAFQNGMSKSDYIRHLILNGGEVDKTYAVDRRDLINQIARVGNNINQSVRLANANCFISSSSVNELMQQLDEIKSFMKEMTSRGRG